jgi:hypothetical protein
MAQFPCTCPNPSCTCVGTCVRHGILDAPTKWQSRFYDNQSKNPKELTRKSM